MMRAVFVESVVLALMAAWKTHDVARDRREAVRECSYRAPSPLRVLAPCDLPSPVPWGVCALALGLGALVASGVTLRRGSVRGARS